MAPSGRLNSVPTDVTWLSPAKATAPVPPESQSGQLNPAATGGPEAGLAAKPLRSFPGGFCGASLSRRIPGRWLMWTVRVEATCSCGILAAPPSPVAWQRISSGPSKACPSDPTAVSWHILMRTGRSSRVDVATGTQTASFSTIERRAVAPSGSRESCTQPGRHQTRHHLGLQLGCGHLGSQDRPACFTLLPDQEGTVWWLAWSPDSQRLAVSRSNGDIAIWNLKEVERVLAKLGLDAGEAGPRTVPVRSTNEDARDLNPSKSVLR